MNGTEKFTSVRVTCWQREVEVVMLVVGQWGHSVCQGPTCRQELQSSPARFNPTDLCFFWETDKRQRRPWEMIDHLIMCGEKFCLLELSMEASCNRHERACCSSVAAHHDPPRARCMSQVSDTLSTPQACHTAGRRRWQWLVRKSTHPSGPGGPSQPPPTLGMQHKLWLARAVQRKRWYKLCLHLNRPSFYTKSKYMKRLHCKSNFPILFG